MDLPLCFEGDGEVAVLVASAEVAEVEEALRGTEPC